MASAVPLRVHESWALALREFALRLKHRSPSVAKATIRTAGYGTAEEAAEKRLKQVNSTFCATTIQQLTSNFWVKKRSKLLLWFIFQQPLKPCPLKACSISGKQTSVPARRIGARSIGDDGVRPLFCRSEAGNDRQDVGLHFVPLLNEQTLGFEQIANRMRVPAHDLFQDGNKDGQGAVADHGTLGDGRKVLVLGNGNGETIAPIHVEHDVDVGAAVANIDDAVRSGPKFLEQLIDDGDLAVSSRHLKDPFDFALLVVFKLRAVDMIGRDNALEGRADHFHRASRDHVEIEVVALNFLGKEAVERIDIGLQPDALARFIEMLAAHLRAELGVVQQQIGEFPPLLHQV